MIKKRKKYITAAAVVIFLCALTSAAFFNGLVVTEYTLKTDKLNAPIKIVFLADLHSCVYGKGQKTLLSKIEAQNPDIIVLAGDIAEENMPHDGTIQLLEGLYEKYDCFYVTGNHEFWSGEVDEIKDIFRHYNVHVLEGEGKEIRANGQPINICGVDDVEIGHDIFKEQLLSASSTIDSSLYTILLSHRPERFEQEASYDFDLILSGHAHGGQWRIPYILNGLIAPDQGFFPKYTSGVYTLNNKNMIVSRGLSRESTRIPRIFNPPEVIVINIVP